MAGVESSAVYAERRRLPSAKQLRWRFVEAFVPGSATDRFKSHTENSLAHGLALYGGEPEVREPARHLEFFDDILRTDRLGVVRADERKRALDEPIRK